MLVYYPIFSRDEAINSEFIGESQFRGFGRQSGKSYTIPQAKGSTGHHRIFYYQLGSLNFLVRHEVDGYVKDDGDQQNFITSAWELLNLSQSKPLKEKRFSSSRLRIQHFGEPVTRESNLEIKTRAAKKPLDLEKVIPRLWISQTPKPVRAHHHGGKFTSPEVEDVTIQIQDWERRHQGEINLLVNLIERIIHQTRAFGGSSTSR